MKWCKCWTFHNIKNYFIDNLRLIMELVTEWNIKDEIDNLLFFQLMLLYCLRHRCQSGSAVRLVICVSELSHVTRFSSFLADQGRKMKIELFIWPNQDKFLTGSEIRVWSTNKMGVDFNWNFTQKTEKCYITQNSTVPLKGLLITHARVGWVDSILLSCKY